LTANKTALCVLGAALVLAALTNRWVAASGSRPGFNIVNFDAVYFGAQWVAFGMTLGALALLASHWRESGHFPPLFLLGVALLGFFVATGIPQTTSAYQWMAGDVGATKWLGALGQSREADRVIPELVGTWRAGEASYRIEAERVTIHSAGTSTVWSKETCKEGASLKFGYATADTIGFHPSAYKLHDLLGGAPVPSLYASCDYRVYAFLKLPDGRLLALRDPHREDLQISHLSRSS